MLKKQQATAIAFLFTTVAVALFNILLNRYQYIVFVFPFAVACLTKEKLSKVAELIGLFAVGLYVFGVEKEYTGLLVLYGAACLYFTYFVDHSKFYIWFSSLLVGIVSFLVAGDVLNRFLHGFLDALLYWAGVWSLHNMIKTAIEKEKAKSVSIDQKYLEVIDELQHVAHESIDALKQLTSGDHGGRSGKGC